MPVTLKKILYLENIHKRKITETKQLVTAWTLEKSCTLSKLFDQNIAHDANPQIEIEMEITIKLSRHVMDNDFR